VQIRIATRKSPLALWQAEHVADRLRATSPGLEVVLVSQDTSADKDLSKPISEIGGKGAFAKEIQQLVLNGSADIAVHSAKDLQAETPDGLFLAAYCARGDARDCLVGSTLDDLGDGATVGTGSARRRVQLLTRRPDLQVVGLRGNIATRLNRAAEMDAIVMAAVALERLDINPGVVDLLSPDQMVPQVGQGALAIECETANEAVREILGAIDHDPTRVVVQTERDFLKTLGGDCDLPAGAHAVMGSNGQLSITGILANEQDRVERHTVTSAGSERPGRDLAMALLDRIE